MYMYLIMLLVYIGQRNHFVNTGIKNWKENFLQYLFAKVSSQKFLGLQ